MSQGKQLHFTQTGQASTHPPTPTHVLGLPSNLLGEGPDMEFLHLNRATETAWYIGNMHAMNANC